MRSKNYTSMATTPQLPWILVQRGYHVAVVGGERVLYVSRTRDGWEYGRIIDGVLYTGGETTRPINRNKVLAERLIPEHTQSKEEKT